MGETFQSTLKEKTSPPLFRVTRMDESWAIEYAKLIKSKLTKEQFKEYPYNGPSELKSYFDGKISDDEFQSSLHKWYENWDVSPQIKQLEACEDTFIRGIRHYLSLQKWGFQIPDSYNVVVTPFTLGGGGIGENIEGHGPTITMWYGRQWGKEGRTQEETLLHEAYHLGADEIIYKEIGTAIPDTAKYQRIKERIVDWCSAEVLVPHVLPTYHYQFSQQIDQPKDHPINAYLQQTNLPVPQRLQLYAQSIKS